jgi:hypothetical protein
MRNTPNNSVLFASSSNISWCQVVRNKAGEVLKTRSVRLDRERIPVAVEDYAEYCSQVGGDRYTCIVDATQEIGEQSQALVEQVYEANTEDCVEKFGQQLDFVVDLFKALEAYYVDNFTPVLRTGTSGD